MRNGDDGFTLLDTTMAMTVMTIVMAIFTSSMLSMYRTAAGVDATSQAQAQLGIAMQRLDREVRYAQGISLPYAVGTDPYVDFMSVTTGAQRCVQLRVHDGVLAQRSWPYGSSPAGVDWMQLATGVTGNTPFVYTAPTGNLGHQQLTVSLSSASGTVRDADVVTFTALNSTRLTGNDYCAAGR